jgi:hypothetical protein
MDSVCYNMTILTGAMQIIQLCSNLGVKGKLEYDIAFCFLSTFVVLKFEPRTSCMLGKVLPLR